MGITISAASSNIVYPLQDPHPIMRGDRNLSYRMSHIQKIRGDLSSKLPNGVPQRTMPLHHVLVHASTLAKTYHQSSTSNTADTNQAPPPTSHCPSPSFLDIRFRPLPPTTSDRPPSRLLRSRQTTTTTTTTRAHRCKGPEACRPAQTTRE